LRREEVAQLASVSTDYYTRVEQGRLAPSEQVLDALCHVLSLTAEHRSYAHDLLIRARNGSALGEPKEREAAHNRLQLRLEQFGSLPAVVLGPRMDILAWNAPAAALFTDFSALPLDERNYVSMIFTVSGMRELYDDWESVARMCVGVLRREAVENPRDPKLAALVGRLSIASEDFRRWWAEHRVAEQDFGTKTLHHPQAGTIRLNWDSFAYAGAHRQQLILWSAAAGSSDAHALAELARMA